LISSRPVEDARPFMTPLASAVLALAITQAPPGRSPYSFEVVAECGTDPQAPACPLEPVCTDDAPACRPPKWSATRGGWVRIETRARAIQRYAAIARSVAATAERLTECGKQRQCEPLGWTGTTRQLALATLTVALHESGLREDVQFGHPPLGRGPAGEACLLQVGLAQAPLYASWLGADEREAIARSPKRRRELAETLLGDSEAALGRCLEVGMRMLSRSRGACGRAGVAWDYGMFSMYGTGRTCRAPVVGKSRSKTFQRLLTGPTDLPDDAAEHGG
jgi:hypothetical protein